MPLPSSTGADMERGETQTEGGGKHGKLSGTLLIMTVALGKKKRSPWALSTKMMNPAGNAMQRPTK